MRNIQTKVICLGVAAAALAGCSSLPMKRSDIVKASASCQDFTVSIYFDRDSASVTREARAVLRDASSMAAGCKIDKVTVTGLADAVGAPNANLQLSQSRAKAVEQALARAGFPSVEFSTAAVGDAGAVTADGQARPLRRRADVAVDLGGPH
ncbi:OmpA family protein [Caulobacter segnis]|uniref:OmpA family protein n=1 Tax=Caulobacter segnis TaxID=88688 RepID=UPI00240EAD41|nr:OmpA family protein [Caulobacter segnis]MDG2521622.1 OmpA family protein [Caulobacter segnis]